MAAALSRVGQSIMDKLLKTANILVSVAEPIIGSLRRPWPAQETLIRGTVAALNRGQLTKGQRGLWATTPKPLRNDRPRAAIVNAEMGTGKTLMGSLTAHILSEKAGAYNVLIVCPPNLRTKWEEEILKTVPAKVIQCENEKAKGKSALRTLRLGLEAPAAGLTFYVMADTANRRHHSQAPLFLERDPRIAVKMDRRLFAATEEAGTDCLNEGSTDAGEIARCPECGKPGWFKEKKVGEASGKNPTKKFLTRKQVLAGMNGEKLVCPDCLAVLSAPLRSSVTTEIDDSSEESFEKITPHAMAREVSPAYWAKKKARRQGLIDLVIIDEAHRAKGDGIQAETLAWIANAGKKVLLLTGTLTGGYARDLFKVCQIVNPLALRKAGFAGKKDAFAATYGATEVRTSYTGPKPSAAAKAVAEAKLRVKSRSFRALPGISANVYPEFLMDRTLFLAMKDLEVEMPQLTESLELIEMDEDMATAYHQLRANFKRFVADQVAASKASAAKGGKDFKNQIQQLISISLQVFLSWPDRLQADAVSGKVGENEVHLPIFDYVPAGGLTNKDSRLVELVNENKKQGRKVLVSVCFTGDRDCAKREEAMLRVNGIKAVTLRGSVAPDKRMGWIRDAIANGCDCVITNPELVKEGLDLLEFPTIVVLQPMANLYTHRQFMARAYRPGQTQDVRHYFLGYADTTQEQIMALVGSKLDSALLAEGNMSESAMLDISTSADSVLRELIQAVIDDSDGLIKARPTKVPFAVTEQVETSEVVIMTDERGIPFPVRVVTRTSLGLPPKRGRSTKGLYHPDQLMLFDFVSDEVQQSDVVEGEVLTLAA